MTASSPAAARRRRRTPSTAGAGTDICIGAPGTTMTFTNCEYTGTPCTGHSVTFSSWKNVAGTALSRIQSVHAADDVHHRRLDGGAGEPRRQPGVATPGVPDRRRRPAATPSGSRAMTTAVSSSRRLPIRRTARQVASVDGYTDPRVLGPVREPEERPDHARRGSRSTTSRPGRRRVGGGDNLSVAWSGPTISRDVISGDYLSATAVGCSGWCPADGAKPYRAQLTSFAGKCADVLNGATDRRLAASATTRATTARTRPGRSPRTARCRSTTRRSALRRRAALVTAGTTRRDQHLQRVGLTDVDVHGGDRHRSRSARSASRCRVRTPADGARCSPSIRVTAPSSRPGRSPPGLPTRPTPRPAWPPPPSRSRDRLCGLHRQALQVDRRRRGRRARQHAGRHRQRGRDRHVHLHPGGHALGRRRRHRERHVAARRHVVVRDEPQDHEMTVGARRDRRAPRQVGQPNAPTSGFMLAYMPLGFGYQVQTCIVTSFGCQKVNPAPDCGLVEAQSVAAASVTNVPSL